MPDELEPEFPPGTTSTGEPVSPKFISGDGEMTILPSGWTFPKA